MADFPIAAGYTDQSAIYGTAFGATMISAFLKNTILMDVTNNEYEGEIKEGVKKVTLAREVLPEVKDYVEGQDLEETVCENDPVDLEINKGKYYNIPVGEVEKKQIFIPDIGAKWANSAGRILKRRIEEDVFSAVLTDVAAANKGSTAGVKTGAYSLGVAGTPIGITKDNVVEYVVDCSSVLDEQEVDDDGRFIILPPLLCGYLMKSSQFTDASKMGGKESNLIRGMIGTINRLEVYMANSLSTVVDSGGSTAVNCLFGHKKAIGFATQITKNEILKNPKRFGDLYRGLQVYGRKLIQPAALGVLYVKKG